MIERAVAALGLGTVLALGLAVLVVGVEALARRQKRRSSQPPASRRGRNRHGEAYR